MATADPDPTASIYLDHAATTPVRPEVIEVVHDAQRRLFGNPSSQHAAGRAARRALEDARDRILELLGCRGGRAGGIAARDRLVFTSGASEANHLAIEGMAAAAATPGTVSYSRRDHASVVQAATAVARRGWRLEELALDAGGRIRAAGLAAQSEHQSGAQSGPRIVAATLVCGQTGVIEDMDAVVRSFPGALVHCDVTQAAGLLPIAAPALDVATLALAPHKFGGPRGIGGLMIRGGVAVAPLQTGTQEEGLRGGTEPVALAVGFAHALELAVADRDAEARRLAGLRDRFEARLLAACTAAGIPAALVAASADRSPHISTIAFPGRDRQTLAMAADLAGVCLATGSACASGSSEPAPALVAMGLLPEVVRGAVRCSFGRSTTAAEVDRAIDRLGGLLRRPGPHSPEG